MSRWQTALSRHPGMAARVLCAQEAAWDWAGRFAAKEALVKALGSPVGLSWHDAEVLVDSSGAPSFQLRGAAAEKARRQGIDAIHLSLSHDGGMAIAFVVCERG